MDFDILRRIAEKTIGIDLPPVKPLNEEEIKKHEEYCKKNNLPHISTNSHIEEPEYRKGRRPYILTEDDIKIIKELLNGFEPEEGNEYYINDFGQISVRTCQASWMALAGREWLIDKT